MRSEWGWTKGFLVMKRKEGKLIGATNISWVDVLGSSMIRYTKGVKWQFLPELESRDLPGCLLFINVFDSSLKCELLFRLLVDRYLVLRIYGAHSSIMAPKKRQITKPCLNNSSRVLQLSSLIIQVQM